MGVSRNSYHAVFSLLTRIHPDITIEWHYNKVQHGKGPMDGIGGTVKNPVYRRVLSGDVVINTPREFAKFANQISSVVCPSTNQNLFKGQRKYQKPRQYRQG